MPEQNRSDLQYIGKDISVKTLVQQISAECEKVHKLACFVQDHTQNMKNVLEKEQFHSVLDDTMKNMKHLREVCYSQYNQVDTTKLEWLRELHKQTRETRTCFISKCLQAVLQIIFRGSSSHDSAESQEIQPAVIKFLMDLISQSDEIEISGEKTNEKSESTSGNEGKIDFAHLNKSGMIKALQDYLIGIQGLQEDIRKYCIEKIRNGIERKCQEFESSPSDLNSYEKKQEFLGKCFEILSSKVCEHGNELSLSMSLEIFQSMKTSIEKAFDVLLEFKNRETTTKLVEPMQGSVSTEGGTNEDFKPDNATSEETLLTCEADVEEDEKWLQESLQRDLREKMLKKARKKAKIGPEGGEIELYGCRLEFPSGAVNEDTEIEISVDNNPENYPQGVIAITPILGCKSTAQFAKEIKIQMKTFFSAADPEEVLDAFVYKKRESGWRCMDKVRLTYQNQIEFSVKNFCKKIAGAAKKDEGKLDCTLENSVFIRKGTAVIASLFTRDQKSLKEFRESFLNVDWSCMLPPHTVRAKIGTKITLKMECTEPKDSKVISRDTSFELTKKFMKHTVYFMLRPLPKEQPVIDIDYTIEKELLGSSTRVEPILLSSVWPVEVKTSTDVPVQSNITAENVYQNCKNIETKKEASETTLNSRN